MVKSIVNILFFMVVILIFLFLATSPTVHGFVTPSPHSPYNQINSPLFNYQNFLGQSQGRSTVELEQNPIYISPSNVRLLTPVMKAKVEEQQPIDDYKNHYVNQNLSPTGSIAASTIVDVNMEFKKSKPAPKPTEDKPKFVFDESNNRFKRSSIGERLSCKIFEEFLGRKVLLHLRPDFLKNIYGKNPKYIRNLELDMYDPITKIAIEYNGIQHYQYVSNMHENKEELNYQKIKDDFKLKRCKELGINLIVVPYTVDNKIKYTEKVREEKLYNFIKPRLEAILAQKENQ